MAEGNFDQLRPQTTESPRKSGRPPTPEEMAQARAEQKEEKELDKEWLASLPEDERKRRLLERRMKSGPVRPGKQGSSSGFGDWQYRDAQERGTNNPPPKVKP